jgi:threonine/homoserine/homoserine lactone efflux protein
MEPFLIGLIVGMVISLPIGPVGLLTIQRTLTQGRFAGIVTGAGAATMDACYGALAGLGLHAVSRFLTSARFWIYLGAGILCLWFGVRAVAFRPVRQTPAHRYSGRGLTWNYVSSVLLTLANPLTILFFIVVFTALRLDKASSAHLLFTIGGIFCGCLLWWTTVSLATARLHTRVHARILTRINHVSAVLIIILGVVALASAGYLLSQGKVLH